MTRGTLDRRRALGKLRLAVPDGLTVRIAALHPFVSGEVEKQDPDAEARYSPALETNGIAAKKALTA